MKSNEMTPEILALLERVSRFELPEERMARLIKEGQIDNHRYDDLDDFISDLDDDFLCEEYAAFVQTIRDTREVLAHSPITLPKDPNERVIEIERRILRKLLEAIVAAGHFYRYHDGEDFCHDKTQDVELGMKEFLSTDEAWVQVYDKDSRRLGGVFLVYGNSGHDLISDYSVAMHELIKPVNYYASLYE